MSVLIKNGRVVTAVNDYRADVFVDGETVALIGHGLDRGLEVAADRIIDATGKFLFAGGIDPHTHMGAAVRGYRIVRHLRDRHASSRVRRHDDHRRLRGPEPWRLHHRGS